MYRFVIVLLGMAAAGCDTAGPDYRGAADAHRARMDAQWREFDVWHKAEIRSVERRIPQYVALCRAIVPARGAEVAHRDALVACSREKMNVDLDRIEAEAQHRLAALERVNDRWVLSMRELQQAERATTALGTYFNPIYVAPRR